MRPAHSSFIQFTGVVFLADPWLSVE